MASRSVPKSQAIVTGEHFNHSSILSPTFSHLRHCLQTEKLGSNILDDR